MSDFLTHPDLRFHENGQTSFQGDLLKLFRLLDASFLRIASQFNANEHRFPIFIPAKELQKVHYLSSFPHLATFPVTLDSDAKNLETFSNSEPLSSGGEVKLTKIAPIKDLLTPAACYHFYVHHQGSTLTGPLYLTTRARCFRREAYYAPLERQWSFHMREIVCVGTSDEVQAFLETCRKRVEEFIAGLGLKIEWLIATDPFFNPSKNPKFLMQKLQPNKTEMVFDGKLAIGSVNFHRNYFGEAFAIQKSGQEAYSGCVAFGVERWMAAIIRQFGPGKRTWPGALAKEIL